MESLNGEQLLAWLAERGEGDSTPAGIIRYLNVTHIIENGQTIDNSDNCFFTFEARSSLGEVTRCTFEIE